MWLPFKKVGSGFSRGEATCCETGGFGAGCDFVDDFVDGSPEGLPSLDTASSICFTCNQRDRKLFTRTNNMINRAMKNCVSCIVFVFNTATQSII